MKKLAWPLLGILTLALSVTAMAASGPSFSDENGFSSWFASAANKMRNHEIMTGYADGSFQGNKPVTRAELAVIFDRFSTLMGKKLYEEPVACAEQFLYGLFLNVQDQKGIALAGAKVSVGKGHEALKEVSQGGGNDEGGSYALLGEGEGYYTFKVEKAGYSSHTETVKLEHDECHVLPQTRTITLFQKQA